MKKYIFYVLGFVFAVFIINNYGLTKATGMSMDPTIKTESYLIIDYNATPEDGDILVLNTANMEGWENSSTQIVKRYYEEYSTDGYYVLGDNAEVSYDSRYCGEIDKDRLIGVVVYIFH